MEVGLIYSTQRAGKLQTRGRDEQKVHKLGTHEPYKHGNMNTEREQA